ncbi:hypothetical protein [Azohydromonas australica]|uniref:hypothetical protein n=1 Tax=Azohydromonas australica TaxID=364039 RepID=UPI0004914D07|nr:hypothetical protein [Azohydromonas australica]
MLGAAYRIVKAKWRGSQVRVLLERRTLTWSGRGVQLLRMEGSVYIGATAHVLDRLQVLRDRPAPQTHLLIMANSMLR